MYKALNDLRERFKMVNIVLEVRDARVCVLHLCYQFSMHADRGAGVLQIPMSSVNPELENLINQTGKDRIILFNKCDLVQPAVLQVSDRWFSS